MPFEFDPLKSAANKAKHGIDFVEAQALWSDPERVEVPARPMDEPRYVVIGRIGETLWTATITYRHENTIRIISVRRVRGRADKTGPPADLPMPASIHVIRYLAAKTENIFESFAPASGDRTIDAVGGRRLPF